MTREVIVNISISLEGVSVPLNQTTKSPYVNKPNYSSLHKTSPVILISLYEQTTEFQGTTKSDPHCSSKFLSSMVLFSVKDLPDLSSK